MRPSIARAIYFSLQFLRREPISSALADVERTEFYSAERLQALQASRMLSQLRFAVTHVPFYQSAYQEFKSRFGQISEWEDVRALMEQLPCVTKEAVQKHSTLLVAQNSGNIRTYPDKTSGSTGTPLIFPCDQRAWAYRHALLFRHLKMFGVHPGEPYALFFGLHWDKKTRIQVAVRDWVFNRVRISAFDIRKDTFHASLKKIRLHAPKFFMGYPSALYDFCFLAREFGVDLREFRLKAVFTTGEPLLSHPREFIEEMTGSRCASHYGSAEGGLTAFECPAGNMHLSVEATWLRLQDPSAATGKALVTDMMLRAFPMINYVIEDEIELGEAHCDCGRAHPVLKTIVGRSGEHINLPNGKVINAHLPTYIFKPLASLKVIQRYRFVLRGKDLQLFLVTSQGFTDEHLHLVERETRKAFGSDIRFTTHIVPEMESLPNAKHKCFVELPE